MPAVAETEHRYPTPEEMALAAIEQHLKRGDWGNAERVLRAYAEDDAGAVSE